MSARSAMEVKVLRPSIWREGPRSSALVMLARIPIWHSVKMNVCAGTQGVQLSRHLTNQTLPEQGVVSLTEYN